MSDYKERTRLLLGDEKLNRLADATVAVFGIGGVGGYVCETLARAGVGHFVLTDSDTVSLSNLNRQIIATRESIGKYKADVMAERIKSINPEAEVEVRRCFYLPENAGTFDFSAYSYVVDAVDTVTAKLEIIRRAKECGVKVISSMGTGNKLDPTRFRVSDISETSVCPLARIMRKECKKRGIEGLKVVWSPEDPQVPAVRQTAPEAEKGRRDIPGSISFVPAAAGLALAAEVVKDLTA